MEVYIAEIRSMVEDGLHMNRLVNFCSCKAAAMEYVGF